MNRRILKASAIAIDVGAPLIATLTQFPIWIERSSEATVSGIFLVFALLSVVPLFRYFKALVKSPSAPLMWGILLAFLYAMRVIIDEMIVISFVGLVSNVLGWVLFRWANNMREVTETK